MPGVSDHDIVFVELDLRPVFHEPEAASDPGIQEGQVGSTFISLSLHTAYTLIMSKTVGFPRHLLNVKEFKNS